MLCLKSLHQSFECRLGTIPSKLVIFSNLLNSTGKKLERQESVHGHLYWWLGASSWRDRTQIALDWSRGGDSKTHQRLAATMKSGIQVILCQFWSSSLFWKQWYLKNLTVLWKLSAETNTVVAVLLTLLWCRLSWSFKEQTESQGDEYHLFISYYIAPFLTLLSYLHVEMPTSKCRFEDEKNKLLNSAKKCKTVTNFFW